ncbi:MAG: gamma carbonic anhydrase family protein [Lentisphaeraceae bacterium]|nr:gamma carbonic anhydrase family protein [Lentisphaeraceae bacterium]
MSSIRTYKGITPKIDSSAYVDESAVIIGDVVIGKESSVWCTTVIRGDVNHIRIGDRSNIQDGSILHVTHKNPEKHPEGYPLIIGDDVTIGHRVTLHGCTLEDCCFIGMNATIMDGAVVESGAMVGACALVTSHTKVESGFLYVGAPAKKVRALKDSEKAMLKQSAINYVNYSRDYLEP